MCSPSGRTGLSFLSSKRKTKTSHYVAHSFFHWFCDLSPIQTLCPTFFKTHPEIPEHILQNIWLSKSLNLTSDLICYADENLRGTVSGSNPHASRSLFTSSYPDSTIFKYSCLAVFTTFPAWKINLFLNFFEKCGLSGLTITDTQRKRLWATIANIP